jgi:hypothetical protein
MSVAQGGQGALFQEVICLVALFSSRVLSSPEGQAGLSSYHIFPKKGGRRESKRQARKMEPGTVVHACNPGYWRRCGGVTEIGRISV